MKYFRNFARSAVRAALFAALSLVTEAQAGGFAKRLAAAPERDPATDPRPWDSLRAARRPYEAEPGKNGSAFAIAFAPGIQTGDDGDDVYALRLSLFGARHHNVGVADISLFANETQGDQSGVQFGGINVVDGDTRAVQLAWLANLAGVHKGASGGGAQLALLGNFGRSYAGPQISLFWNRNTSGGPLQLALGANLADEFTGAQIAAINVNGDVFRGIQLGIANGGAKDFGGVQLGLFNGVPGTMHGVQVGLLNSARSLQGIQVGLLNRVDDSSLPWLPLLRVAF